MITPSQAASGSTILKGYSVDGQFVPSEPMEDIYYLEFVGHEENVSQSLGFPPLDADYELLTLMAGSYNGSPTPDINLTSYKFTKRIDRPSNYPDNILMQLMSVSIALPINFPLNTILPEGTAGYIYFDNPISWCRLYLKKVKPKLVGILGEFP